MSDIPQIPIEEKALRKAYAEACAERDLIEKRIAPVRARLVAAADAAEAARVYAMSVRHELDVARGGTTWFALKKRIRLMADILGSGKFLRSGGGNG